MARQCVSCGSSACFPTSPPQPSPVLHRWCSLETRGTMGERQAPQTISLVLLLNLLHRIPDDTDVHGDRVAVWHGCDRKKREKMISSQGVSTLHPFPSSSLPPPTGRTIREEKDAEGRRMMRGWGLVVERELRLQSSMLMVRLSPHPTPACREGSARVPCC